MNNIMIFSTDNNLDDAINVATENENYLFSVGSSEDHSLRYIEYHLQEYDLVIIDLNMPLFETILYSVIDRNWGDDLGIPMVILLPEGESVTDVDEIRRFIGEKSVLYEHVNYSSNSWLDDLLEKLKK